MIICPAFAVKYRYLKSVRVSFEKKSDRARFRSRSFLVPRTVKRCNQSLAFQYNHTLVAFARGEFLNAVKVKLSDKLVQLIRNLLND
jgi:hypothetical protein